MNAAARPNRRRLLQAAVSAATLAATGIAQAQPRKPIVLGHSYPASGVLADTIHAMKSAIDAAVLAVNGRGGIGGRPVKVVSLDDGYDAGRCVANAETLRTQHEAIALLAPVGTPSLAVLAPWAAQHGLPLIGARSGADGQRGYQREVFFNFASFGDEVRYLARHFATLGVKRIAMATWDNPTGRSIADQFASAVPAHGLELAGNVSFAPDGSNAAEVATRLMSSQAKALLLGGGGIGCVALVRELVARGWTARTMYSLSTVQPQALTAALGPKCDGMVFAQVVPLLSDQRQPLVAQYRAAVQKLSGEHTLSPIGLEAWISAQIALQALARIKGAVAPAALIDALEGLGRFDVGGFQLQYDRVSHHGTRYVDLGILNGGRVAR